MADRDFRTKGLSSLPHIKQDSGPFSSKSLKLKVTRWQGGMSVYKPFLLLITVLQVMQEKLNTGKPRTHTRGVYSLDEALV